MAADKPLQDVYSTVRLPITDAIQITDNNQQSTGTALTGFGWDYGMFWNCYPQFFTDRAQNQYSSQFDTWTTKRGPIAKWDYADIANGTIPTANLTSSVDNICIKAFDDTFVAAVLDSTASVYRIIQYKPLAGTSLQIGTIAGTLGDSIFLTELVVAGVPYIGVTYINAAETVSTGAYAASAAGTFVAASLTVIADVDFPANLASTSIRGPFIQIDGYTCVMSKQAGIYNSDLNSITSWNALGVVLVSAFPDQGVGLARYKNMIVAFGEDSIEFFTNAAGAPPASPFGRLDQALVNFGTPNARCVITIAEAMFWWAKGSGGKWGLYKLDGGYAPIKVSSQRDDLMAARNSRFPELYYLLDQGKEHIISTVKVSSNLLFNATVNDPVTNLPLTVNDPFAIPATPTLIGEDTQQGWLCWDIQTSTSWIWAHGNSYYPDMPFPMMAQSFNPTTIYKSITSFPCLFSFDRPRQRTAAGWGNVLNQGMYQNVVNVGWYYTDQPLPAAGSNPTGITSAIVFNMWDFGTEKRKRIHKFKVIQRVYSPSSGGSVSQGQPYTWVVYNKTDSVWTNAPNFGTTPVYARPCTQVQPTGRSYINNLGAARKWCFAIIQKSDMNWACRGIELDISQAG